MIEVRELRKLYGTTVAVSSVSFVAPDGRVTGLLGPNGAGKTTTLRALAGLSRPDAGRVAIDGHDPQSDATSARARLGVVPESVGLYDRLTVREHLRYSGELYGVDGIELEARIGPMLDRFGLTTIADRRASSLSLGQRQQLAFARALVHEPRNVVLDEPTNGLDVMSVRQTRREVRRLADAGTAVLLSSHVMPEVSALCDHIVVLSRGSVVATGTPAELLAQTGRTTLEDAFVAVIGSDEGLS